MSIVDTPPDPTPYWPALMANQEISTRAREGFCSWMGDEPDEVLEVSLPQGENDPIQVLFFVDDEDEDEEPTTYIATAGLCGRALGWSPGGGRVAALRHR